MKRTTASRLSSHLFIVLLLCVQLTQSNGAPVKRQVKGWWDRYQNGLLKIRGVLDGLLRAGSCFGAALAQPCPNMDQARDPLGQCRPINELILELEMLLERSNPGRRNEIELLSADVASKN